MKSGKKKNREKILSYQRAYYARNKARRSVRGRGELYRLANNLRRRLNLALRQNWKSGHTLELLGMDLKEFRIYIQGQFKPGMTWENYGPVWHIDHVRPCAKFDLSDPENQKVCFRWDNLQPMFAEENLKKGDRP